FIVHKEIPWVLERFKEDMERGQRRIFVVLLDKVTPEMLGALPKEDRQQAHQMFEALSKVQYIDAADGDLDRVTRELAPLLPQPIEGGHQFIVNWPRLATFKGRDALLTKLHETLKHGGRVSVHASISGMGGVGKTQLAVEYAHRYRFHYPAGVYWIN